MNRRMFGLSLLAMLGIKQKKPVPPMTLRLYFINQDGSIAHIAECEYTLAILDESTPILYKSVPSRRCIM